MALGADVTRTLELGGIQNYPVAASTTIYKGAAVGLVKSTGMARPLATSAPADLFLGFANAQANNSAGAAGAINVAVRRRGQIQLTVPGAAITDPAGAPVFAADDDTFSFSQVGRVFIGTMSRYVSAGVAIVAFNVGKFKDPHADLVAELKSSAFTTAVTDSGKVFVIDTDAIIITLHAAAAGAGSTRFMTVGAYGTVGFSLAPQAVDKVQGPNIAGTDNKKLILTKATAQRGDYVQLEWGHVDGPTVTVIRGVWATEP